jgi:hypothetical protein
MDQNRAALEESLYQRFGELSAYLGRYDMYAVLLENMLTPNGQRDPAAPRLTVRTRGAVISRLLHLRRLPDKIQADFRTIDEELQVLLERHEISARNPAPLARQPPKSVPNPSPSADAVSDWYDMANADEATIQKSIDAIERDILQAVKLYIRLAAVAQDVRDAMTRLH